MLLIIEKGYDYTLLDRDEIEDLMKDINDFLISAIDVDLRTIEGDKYKKKFIFSTLNFLLSTDLLNIALMLVEDEEYEKHYFDYKEEGGEKNFYSILADLLINSTREDLLEELMDHTYTV